MTEETWPMVGDFLAVDEHLLPMSTALPASSAMRRGHLRGTLEAARPDWMFSDLRMVVLCSGPGMGVETKRGHCLAGSH